jgi:PAS domain S-box-containing protein
MLSVGKPLNVLIIEDSSSDALLILRQIKAQGYDPVSKRVENARDMDLALENGSWDIIISDYVLPELSGLEALKILQSKNLDIPCIITSGRIDDETAVAAMKAGAKDYIMKDNLKRLGPAVERELLEAQTRQERLKAREELQKNEIKLASIVESTNDAISTQSLDGTITSWNQGAERIYSYTQSEAIGRNVAMITAPEHGNDTPLILLKIRNGEKLTNYETIRRRKDGTKLNVSLTASPLKGQSGEIIGASVITRDITEKKTLERQIILSNEVLNLFWRVASKQDYLNKAADMIYNWCRCECIGIRLIDSPTNTLPYVAVRGFSKEFLELEGRLVLGQDTCACTRTLEGNLEAQDLPACTSAGSFFLSSASEFVNKLTPEQLSRFRGHCLRSGYQTIIVVPIRHHQTSLGGIHILDKAAGALSLKDIEALESIANILGQGIYRFDIEEKMKRQEEELRALSHRLVEVQESERRTIARELHDEIGQTLTALKMLLAQASRSNAPNSAASLEEAKTVASDLMQQVREMSLNLRPSMLDDLGLLPTLVWHFERFTSKTGIEIQFEHDGLQPGGNKLSPELNTAAYRVIQEALTNIARYAEVKKALVDIRFVNNTMLIRIEDTGRGFSLSELNAYTSTGISGMRERVRLLGGKFTLETTPGKGTSVLVELPGSA